MLALRLQPPAVLQEGVQLPQEIPPGCVVDEKIGVHQRADRSAAVLDTIEKGETFQAVALVPGNDGKPWFLGVYNGRVPQDGTTII